MLSKGVIYGATGKETVSGKSETYTGLSEPAFQSSYGGHLPHLKTKIQTTLL